MKILLLEDDLMLNDAIAQYLTSVGHLIVSTKDGKSCLEILKNEKFDMLILDINLPDINGFTILEQMHENKRMIPTIFISALLDIEDISRAFDIGCHDYLKKPFHLKELNLRINKILKNSVVPQNHKRLSSSYSFDHDTMTLYFDNEPHILPKRQLLIISLLSKNRSLVVNYDMFREYAYNGENIDTATIRAEVNRVKKVLKEDFIINIRGIGYMVERPK
ncbi:DNA-binding response regulator [Halarcobacter ebronensis]|uniref:DNA-binding response regulator n=1 Tax=Halarcobacter ebronensis TaxID=1462615 RepID=A0A4V1LR72_9BACT|nr:response regulator transcription factor [Halarcobacter ebronensis]QKF83128.1 two-component system response regulator [Halarcobacter ebronensis]RXJ67188.1 DNA-binding response regulator [Halarcobacter ebronensis]RXK05234.1 DNA-binding response regulator [Halarcobacter ebronensis]